MSIFRNSRTKAHTIFICQDSISPDLQYQFYCRSGQFLGLKPKSPHRIVIKFKPVWCAYFVVMCPICGREYEVIVHEGERK